MLDPIGIDLIFLRDRFEFAGDALRADAARQFPAPRCPYPEPGHAQRRLFLHAPPRGYHQMAMLNRPKFRQATSLGWKRSPAYHPSPLSNTLVYPNARSAAGSRAV